MTGQAERRTRLVLEISDASDPVSGLIGLPHTDLDAFTGWSELAAAIERHRTRDGGDMSTHALSTTAHDVRKPR